MKKISDVYNYEQIYTTMYILLNINLMETDMSNNNCKCCECCTCECESCC